MRGVLCPSALLVSSGRDNRCGTGHQLKPPLPFPSDFTAHPDAGSLVMHNQSVLIRAVTEDQALQLACRTTQQHERAAAAAGAKHSYLLIDSRL
jgi:hypothetical protein